MASKAGARIKITLRCSECKQRNYNTMKNKKNTPDPVSYTHLSHPVKRSSPAGR